MRLRTDIRLLRVAPCHILSAHHGVNGTDRFARRDSQVADASALGFALVRLPPLRFRADFALVGSACISSSRVGSFSISIAIRSASGGDLVGIGEAKVRPRHKVSDHFIEAVIDLLVEHLRHQKAQRRRHLVVVSGLLLPPVLGRGLAIARRLQLGGVSSQLLAKRPRDALDHCAAVVGVHRVQVIEHGIERHLEADGFEGWRLLALAALGEQRTVLEDRRR
jgi:hypothetical protein